MSDEFKTRTINSLSWSAISQTVTQVLNFIIGVILVRLLTPDVFGLMGMVGVLAGFASLFSDLGMGAALIQKKDAEQKHYSSIFWINIILGIALMTIFMCAAPWIAGFYKEPDLVPLTYLISLNFFVGSFNIVQKTLMQKKMNFKSLAIVEIVVLVFSGSIAIVLAVSGFGVWSLAIKSLLSTSIAVVLMWYISGWRPRFLIDWMAVRELLGFSSNLFGFRTMNYFIRNADNLLVGRFLGSSALGLYDKAYSMMLFPLNNISRVIERVMFPAFSSIQEDKLRIKNIYLQITRSVALITFPMMFGLLVVTESFVITVFGSQWSGMIPVMQALSIVGAIQSIGTLNGNIYLSQGRTGLQFKVGTVLGILGVVAIVVGLQWGIKGVAHSYALFSLLAAGPGIKIAVSLVGITFKEVVVNLSGVFGSAVGMAIGVYLLGYLLPVYWQHWAYLAVQVPFGITLYLLLIRTFRLKAYMELKTLLREQWQLRFAKTSSTIS
ncbi:MAG: MOP flippase family protein [Candidatus Scalindua sp.]|jgi:PST family polysaccharide transporter|nr:MOP flippase family protein [Candidatus Scalindua sp.]MBT6227976.1 MOP flippase family protein [Candidatus Scalindua sp.]MBT6561708.1 MOP flippase family protein [Candidatus Scalindua sp.]MBT7211110.1 MOP flippase family protein [Candidatus Scalindua sp.]